MDEASLKGSTIQPFLRRPFYSSILKPWPISQLLLNTTTISRKPCFCPIFFHFLEIAYYANFSTITICFYEDKKNSTKIRDAKQLSAL
jgi:hypothetical protein